MLILYIAEEKIWQDFWTGLWGKGREQFETEYIQERWLEIEGRAVPFKLCSTSQFRLDWILVRPEWDLAF